MILVTAFYKLQAVGMIFFACCRGASFILERRR